MHDIRNPRESRNSNRPTIGVMRGRLFVLAIFATMIAFGLGVGLIVTGRDWRQTERLVASGLRNPRGLVLQREDALVVAEAGLASRETSGDDASGRLTWVRTDTNGRGTLLENLPSTYRASDRSIGGANGLARAPDSTLRMVFGACGGPDCATLQAVDREGGLSLLTDLGAFARAHPRSDAGSPAPASDPWAVAVSEDGSQFVTDAGTGTLMRIGAEPASVPTIITRFDRAVRPTGLAIAADGALLVANFTQPPHSVGAGSILRVSLDDAVATLIGDLTMPIGIAVEPDGQIMVLEHAATFDFERGFAPSSGRLVRIDPRDPVRRTVLAEGLRRPAFVHRAANGRVYVTTTAAADRSGDVLQIRRLGPVPPRRWI
jgi:sugar lactone lactonase YvrE